MIRKLCQLIICHDTHPNVVDDNDEQPKYINNIYTNKNSDIRNNDTFCNNVNSRNKNSNNFNNNSLDNGDTNNIDTENNIDNSELCYNCKRRQSAHLIQKYGESSPYAIQFIQQSNTNICQNKFKQIDIRTKKYNATVEYYLCHQYKQHLTLIENYTTHYLFCPSFLLFMLEGTALSVHYGGDYIWHFIPTDCRYWWIHHLK